MTTNDAITAILNEVERARKKHGPWPDDVIHCASNVGEEAGELLKAANQAVYENGPVEEMKKEALHTAATAIRFLTERVD